jgi:hypothetical protein
MSEFKIFQKNNLTGLRTGETWTTKTDLTTSENKRNWIVNYMDIQEKFSYEIFEIKTYCAIKKDGALMSCLKTTKEEFLSHLLIFNIEHSEIVTFEEWENITVKNYKVGEIQAEITEEEYNEKLNILPPLVFSYSHFIMCTAEINDIRRQYINIDGRFFWGYINSPDRKTWLHSRAKVQEFLSVSQEKERA